MVGNPKPYAIVGGLVLIAVAFGVQFGVVPLAGVIPAGPTGPMTNVSFVGSPTWTVTPAGGGTYDLAVSGHVHAVYTTPTVSLGMKVSPSCAPTAYTVLTYSATVSWTGTTAPYSFTCALSAAGAYTLTVSATYYSSINGARGTASIGPFTATASSNGTTGPTSSSLLSTQPFTYSQVPGTTRAQFTDHSSTVNATITGVLWQFSAGTPQTASGPQVAHTFPSVPQGGQYFTVVEQVTAKSTVSNATLFNTTSGVAFIYNPSCVACTPAVIALFTYNVDNLSVSFTDKSSVTGGAAITGVSWSFGDGASATGSPTSHTFGSPGVYAVTETVTGTSSSAGSLSNAVTINVTVTLTTNGGGSSTGCGVNAQCPPPPLFLNPAAVILALVGTALVLVVVLGGAMRFVGAGIPLLIAFGVGVYAAVGGVL